MASEIAASPGSLRALRDELANAATSPAAIVAFPTNYAVAADSFMVRILRLATGDSPSGLTLIAVGGYGRGELCPGSDLDLVLLHRGRRDIDQLASSIWYPIWDEGVRLDHSVRTPRELLTLARSDLRVALGLLDGRYVAGDAELAGDVLPRARELFRTQGRRHLAALAESVDDRRNSAGEVAFVLEPDLKESRGGLRDFQALRAVAAALEDLAPKLRIESVASSYRFLLSVRVALQVRTRRPTDRLLLELQDDVADLLGVGDADALMARVAAAGRELAWACDDALRRTRSYLGGPSRRGGGRDRVVAPGLVLRDGEIALGEPSGVGVSGGTSNRNPRPIDSTVLLQAAATAAEQGYELAPDLLERAGAEVTAVPAPWSIEVRQAFLGVLAAGPRTVSILEALDRHRLLELLVPEWTAVRSLPQRNAYHRFTVDRHLLETVANAGSLMRQVSRPDLLLTGAFLHDIGKGFKGDHTVAGMAVAPVIAERMGFAPADVATLTSLVEHHLLLPDAATRRDLDDPATIELVATRVRDRQTLELLAALAEADGLATGPAAWSPWKAGLVRDLASRVARFLSASNDATPTTTSAFDNEMVRHLVEALTHTDGIAVTVTEGAGCSVVTLAAADRPGLLAMASGVLSLNGFAVLSASAGEGGAGIAVGRFEVESRYGRTVDPALIERDLDAALSGELALEARLEAREREHAARRPRAARPAQVVVLIDDGASTRSTVIEVRAPDSFGRLHRIARTLTECDLDVVSAHASTLGHEVVDVFYVQEKQSREKLREQRRDEVRRRLYAALGAAGTATSSQS